MSKAKRWSAEQLAGVLSGGHVRCQGFDLAAGKDRTSTVVASGGRGCGGWVKKSLEGVAEYLFQLDVAGIPTPEFEYRFHPTRQWRTDFTWLSHGVVGEYEGGVFLNGAHVRGQHYESDCEKYTEAAILGLVVIRFTHRMVRNGMALSMTERTLAMRNNGGIANANR